MADSKQRTAEDDQAPVPGAAPAPAPASPEVSARVAELETELTRLRTAAAAGQSVLVRVLPPHVSFSYAGRTVGTEPVPVPLSAVSAMAEAALDAGVTLSQEG